MDERKDKLMIRRVKFMVSALFLAGMVSACGQERETTDERSVESAFDKEQETKEADEIPEEVPNAGTGTAQDSNAGTEEAFSVDKWSEQFGEYCISEQTFEVELSEYNGKVCFVPYRPSEDEEFHMQIVQNGQAMTELRGYVPEKLEGEAFRSLDAVSFYDVNYDGQTDIVLVETYGDTSFAAVYYG